MSTHKTGWPWYQLLEVYVIVWRGLTHYRRKERCWEMGDKVSYSEMRLPRERKSCPAASLRPCWWQQPPCLTPCHCRYTCSAHWQQAWNWGSETYLLQEGYDCLPQRTATDHNPNPIPLTVVCCISGQIRQTSGSGSIRTSGFESCITFSWNFGVGGGLRSPSALVSVVMITNAVTKNKNMRSKTSPHQLWLGRSDGQHYHYYWLL